MRQAMGKQSGFISAFNGDTSRDESRIYKAGEPKYIVIGFINL
jgi:hypothetical protein